MSTLNLIHGEAPAVQVIRFYAAAKRTYGHVTLIHF